MTEQPGDTWSYTAGDWYGMVGPAVTLLLPPSERDRVVALWPLVDDGAGFDDVLDALLGGGLSALPGFALVGTGADEGTTRVLVRGTGVTASVLSGGQEVDLDGGTGGTWTEQTLPGVEALTVSTDTAAVAGRKLPIVQGLVRVAGVSRPEQPEQRQKPQQPEQPAVEAPSPAAVLVPGFGPAEPSLVEPPVEPEVLEPAPVEPPAVGMPNVPPPSVPPPPPSSPPEPAPLDEPPPLDEPAPLDDPSPLEESAPLDESAAAEEPTPLEPPEGLATQGFEQPVPLEEWTPLSAEPPPSAEPPAQSEAVEDDAPTELQPVITGEADETERPEEEPALETPATQLLGQPAAQAEPVATLTISDGQTVPVDGPMLIGRAPTSSRATGSEEPLLVTVPSPLQEISSTHVEVRPAAGGAVVTDMGSTNGTVVVHPGTGPEELQPGVPVPLLPGSVINLGDGVTIEVQAP